MVLDLFSEASSSLKDKRHIVVSIKEKLKNKFNISIIESDYHDLWQKAQISIAMVSTQKKIIDKTFLQIEDFIFKNYPVQILDIHCDFIK